MSSADNTVHHLLWCILIALRTADQEKPFTSEIARRRFIANWLDTARGNPSFRGMNAEFTTLRQLLETSDKAVPVDSTLSVLLSHATAVEQCDLFRFRSTLNILMQKGWRLVICRFPENITTELMQRRQDRRKHALQLTRMENAFQPTGYMVLPVTFQLLLNRTAENNDDAELIFHTEGFQVVVANELELDNRRLIRTLHIGTPSLPTGEWSPSMDRIWQPPRNSAPSKKRVITDNAHLLFGQKRIANRKSKENHYVYHRHRKGSARIAYPPGSTGYSVQTGLPAKSQSPG